MKKIKVCNMLWFTGFYNSVSNSVANLANQRFQQHRQQLMQQEWQRFLATQTGLT